MSKTNHRINRDREEKLPEPKTHKGRRGFKKQAATIVDLYESSDDILDLYEDEEFETSEKIRRR